MVLSRGSSPRRRGPAAPAIALIPAILPGCVATRPDPQPESAVAAALGIEHAVTFRREGAPVDEPDAAGGDLPLGEAVRRAVATDPRLQAALARVHIAIADADQARRLPNPVLDVVLRWPESGAAQIELSLAQDLISLLQRPRRVSAADNRLWQSSAGAVVVALDVVAGVQERYASAQALDRLVPVLEQRLAILQRLLQVARTRLDAGEGTRADVTTLDAQRVELEVELAEALQQRLEERLGLARLIGEPSSAAGWHLDPWGAPALEAAPESAWVGAALAHRPEVQSIGWRLAALGDGLALARSLPWEGLGASADLERDDAGWSAGPGLSTPVPLLDTGRARIDRVTAELIEARHDLTLAQRQVVEEVRVAYRAFAASGEVLRRVREELVPLQTQRRRQSEASFLAGQTDVTGLFLAEQDLRAAEARAVEVERRMTVALVRLHRAAGGPGAVPGAP